MAEVESNIDEVQKLLDELVASVAFDRPGKEGSLGLDMANIVAIEIATRTIDNEQSADGSTLKANAPKYAAYKAKKYSVSQPLIRTGQLLSMASLLGETTITADEVQMRYGTNSAPTSGSTGYISNADRKTTDRQKAEFVSEDRPFFGLDERIGDELAKEAGGFIEDLLT